jgi:uncharacterized protein
MIGFFLDIACELCSPNVVEKECLRPMEGKMRRYHLAKLVQLAKKLETRKRLQKVVFLLQSAGWPVEAEYRLHFFGPYSDDVAHLTDEMVHAELLKEEERPFGDGQTYNYELSTAANESLTTFEQTSEGQKAVEDFRTFEGKAKELLGKEAKVLEHAATLVYFRQRAKLRWQDAIEKTCQMKKLKKNSVALRGAEKLARDILRENSEEA